MDITPYAKNAKKHPRSQIKALGRAIEAFGFSPAIEVDTDGVIVSGHGRFQAAQELGLTKTKEAARAPKGADYIPYIILKDLSPLEIKQKRLADNKLAETDVDMILALEELKDIQLEGGDITLTGYDEDLLVEPDAKDDEVPEDAPSVAKLGDLWALGPHRVLCGDSTSLEAVERLMDGKKADMVFTDPPYNVDYTGKTKDALKIQNDKKDDGAFYAFLLDVFTNMAVHTKSGGGAYITHSDSEGLNFRRAFVEAGFQMKQCLIWNKNSMVMGRQDYHWKHEPILYGWQKGDAHSWYGPRNQTTVWDIARPSRSSEHPTMKPVELITNAITNSSKSEDIILDLFLGSGSTLIAAEKTGRICYGMELDPKYMDVIIKRWEDYTHGKATKIN